MGGEPSWSGGVCGSCGRPFPDEPLRFCPDCGTPTGWGRFEAPPRVPQAPAWARTTAVTVPPVDVPPVDVPPVDVPPVAVPPVAAQPAAPGGAQPAAPGGAQPYPRPAQWLVADGGPDRGPPMRTHPGFGRPAVPVDTDESRSAGRPARFLVVAMVFVLLVVVAGAALVARIHPWQSSRAVAVPSASAPIPVAANVRPATTAPATGQGSVASFVAAVDALLDRSATAREIVARAAGALDACRISPTTAAAQFDRAAQLRGGLVADAGVLSTPATTAVPGGGDIVTSFSTVQRLSERADGAFSAWAKDVAQAGCTSTAPHTSNWVAANGYSTQATAAKREFIAIWNPLAARQGLRARPEGQL
jgi:hypothetical protein